MIFSRFFKSKKAATTVKSNAVHQSAPDGVDFYYLDYDWSKVQNHLDDAAALLDVTLPPIHVVPYMVDNGIHFFLSDGKLGNDLSYYTGYFDPNTEEIFVGRYNPQTKHLHTDEEMLFTALHELRHVWQKRHHEDIYYDEPNAVAYETIFDNSEVDADAFAIAYLQQRTAFEKKAYMTENITNYLLLDGGRRIIRTKELKNLYFRM